MRTFLRLSAVALLAVCFAPADVIYSQTTKFEGGTLIDMMQKMASMPMMGRMMGGANMKQAFEEQHYDVFIKGNKMARLGKLTSSVYDLDAGTMTTLDNTKQTFSTETFEEMQQRMEQMQQRMSRGKTGDLDFDVKVSSTGQTREIDGVTAKETLIVMTAKQASAQGQMIVTMHAWMVPSTPATKDVTEFQRKLGAKYAYAFASGGPGMLSTAKGMSQAMKEAMQQDGYPILTEVEITGVTPSGPMGPMGGGDTKSDPNAPLIKLQTVNGGFAQGGVDDSKFAIPAGYKETKGRMGR
jgi:hypothetical protein